MGKSPPKLSAKQKKFIDVWFETGNKTEAYRQSYSIKNKKKDTIRKEAQRLSQNPHILKEYEKLTKKHEEKALWTREMAFKALTDVMAETTSDRTFNVTVSAIKELNAIGDIYPKENEVDITDPVYLAKALKKLSEEELKVFKDELHK